MGRCFAAILADHVVVVVVVAVVADDLSCSDLELYMRVVSEFDAMLSGIESVAGVKMAICC